MYINSAIPWITPLEKFENIVQLAYRVGYQAAIVDLRSKQEYSEFIKSKFYLRNNSTVSFPISPVNIANCKASGSQIPLFPRITINPQDPEELKKNLSQIIQQDCLIAVESQNKNVLEIAARDGRVDIISLPEELFQKAMTKGIVSLAKQNNVCLDISLTPLLSSVHYKRTRLMRVLYRLIKMAKPNSVHYLIGSHFGCKDDPFLIRGPKESITLLQTLLDIPEMYAKTMVKSNPEEIIKRFLKRRHGLFIEPGVEICDKRTSGEN